MDIVQPISISHDSTIFPHNTSTIYLSKSALFFALALGSTPIQVSLSHPKVTVRMLVSRVGDDETAEIPLLQSRSHTSIESHSFRLRRSRMVFICVCFIVFAINCGAYLTSVPSIRIIEDIVCHHYYERTGRQELNIMHSEIVQSTNLISGVRGTGDIDERLCKVKEVQHELAMIGGILQLTQAIPGKLLHDYLAIGFVKH